MSPFLGHADPQHHPCVVASSAHLCHSCHHHARQGCTHGHGHDRSLDRRGFMTSWVWMWCGCSCERGHKCRCGCGCGCGCGFGCGCGWGWGCGFECGCGCEWGWGWGMVLSVGVGLGGGCGRGVGCRRGGGFVHWCGCGVPYGGGVPPSAGFYTQHRFFAASQGAGGADLVHGCNSPPFVSEVSCPVATKDAHKKRALKAPEYFLGCAPNAPNPNICFSEWSGRRGDHFEG